ncbi:MAG: hypothetical protein ACLFOY_09915 [Desulfatibacillaceae bacterium]
MTEHMDKGALPGPAPGVRWVVDVGGVLVLREEDGETMMLAYPRALVWDLAVRNRPWDEAVRLLVTVSDVPALDSTEYVDEWIAEWRGGGWLVEAHG